MSRIRIAFAALVFSLTLVPSSVSAKETLDYEFSQGKINARWAGHGEIKMQKEESGIAISTAGTGGILTYEEPDFFPEGASLTIDAEKPVEVYFFWIYKNDPSKKSYDIPLALSAGKSENLFSLSDDKKWRKDPKIIGLIFPPDTRVKLERLTLFGWNPMEKFIEKFKSFWTFDSYSPYSINFLWGPYFAANPLHRQVMFRSQPPYATPVTLVLNGVLAGIIVAILVFDRGGGAHKKRLFKFLAGLFIFFWIIMDLRMGGEFIGWVSGDFRNYVSAASDTRTFRDRDRFYDFATFIKPYLFDRDSYVFYAQLMWPYLGNIRYLTYPAIPGIDFENDDTWVVYNRPDIALGSDNALQMDGQTITLPGRILARFDENSFVFRTFEKPAPVTPVTE